MRNMILQGIALSLSLWVHAASANYRQTSNGLSGVHQRDVVIPTAPHRTAPNSPINLLSTKRSSNASEGDDSLDGIQFTQSSRNSTFNSTYLVFTNTSSSAPGSGRRLIEVDSSAQHTFLTANCDSRTLGSTEAAAIESMLAQVQANLRIVIAQAKKGIASKYGFQALFKSQSNSGQVASVFEKIMVVATANNDPDQHPGIAPLIICAAPDATDRTVRGMEKLFEACEGERNQRAVQPRGSNIVVLCPAFLELPGVPPRGGCPRMDSRTGGMVPNMPWLQLNRQATFVHEMVHMYLGHGYAFALNETYNVGDAVALDEEASMRNPSNYAFFYAAVIAGCRKWPYKSTKGGDDGGL